MNRIYLCNRVCVCRAKQSKAHQAGRLGSLPRPSSLNTRGNNRHCFLFPGPGAASAHSASARLLPSLPLSLTKLCPLFFLTCFLSLHRHLSLSPAVDQRRLELSPRVLPRFLLPDLFPAAMAGELEGRSSGPRGAEQVRCSKQQVFTSCTLF